MGLHVRSHAYADPSTRKRFRYWYRQLACFYLLGSSLTNRAKPFDLEILPPICW